MGIGVYLLNQEANNKKKSWTTREYKEFNIPTNEFVSKYLGYIDVKLPSDLKIKNEFNLQTSELPESYSVAEAHSDCTSTTEIRDQSSCGSCWAVSTESMLSDRHCIEKKQSTGNVDNTQFSSKQILANSMFPNQGCNGGNPVLAARFMKIFGVVTGGKYNTKNTCAPYPFEPCNHHTDDESLKNCSELHFTTPKRFNKCDNESINFNQDKTYVREFFLVKGVENIKRALVEGGSLTAAFTVKEGFVGYSEGIYVCSEDEGKALGGHAVRLIGYGVEDGVEYWELTNNWNQNWGNEGKFRVKINDGCGMEKLVVGVSGFYNKN